MTDVERDFFECLRALIDSGWISANCRGLTTMDKLLSDLILARDKVDLLIGKISINEPLIEVSAILSACIEQWKAEAEAVK